MFQPTARLRQCFRRVPIVAAVAAAVLFAPWAAVQAQSFSQTGTNATLPNNYLPFTGSPTSLDFGTDTIVIGNGADGSFSALSGATLSAGALHIATGGTGVIGSFTASGIDPTSGSPTRVTLGAGGATNRLVVGSWGDGTLSVSAGAVVDATANRAGCSAAGSGCYSLVGSAAGATGTLEIAGAGSEVHALRDFIVASAFVDTTAGFGTAGANASGNIRVLAGGALHTEGATLGVGPAGIGFLGTEKSFASALIDGAGSQWAVSRNTVDNLDATFIAAGHANAEATITVRNGGTLTFDTRGTTGYRNDFVLGANGGKADLRIESGGKLLAIGDGVGTGTFAIGGWTGTGTRASATVTGAGSELSVGYEAGVLVGGPGSTARLDVLDSGKLSAPGGLYIAPTAGSAVINVDHARIDIGTSDQRLVIGFGGDAAMTITHGGVVDAALPATFCKPDDGCTTDVAGAAGGTTHLTISGTGSELRALRNFGLAGAYVDLNNNFGPDRQPLPIGTQGGATTGTIDVLAGGTLRTENAIVGRGPYGPDATGTETANGTVTISGPGSSWILTHNSIDHRRAELTIGGSAGGTGTVTISNGGLLWMDGSAVSSAASGQFDTILLGRGGGKGTLVVTGGGSSLQMPGYGGAIQAGRDGASGEGTFSVLAGASASAVFLTVGRDGSTGHVLVRDSQSVLTLSGEGIYASGGTGPAVASIGWGGKADMTVSNGARVLITDDIDTSGTANRPPGFFVGRSSVVNNATLDGVGRLDIDSGATFQVLSTSIGPVAGAPDNYNAVGHIGWTPGSEGTVNIASGGKLLLTGQALSTAANPRGTNLHIGGSSDTAAGGVGKVYVTGPGSELRVEGADAFITVGRNGNGTLDLKNEAKVVVTGGGMNVGRASAGVGLLALDHSFLEITGQNTSSAIGAYLTIGNRGGSGTVTVTNGSVVTIENQSGSAGAALNLGGTAPNPLGTGVLTLSGGSKIDVLAAPGLATVSIGHDGSGTLNVESGSTVNAGRHALTGFVADGSVYVGRQAGGVGLLSLSGGSTVNAGFVGIGVSAAGSARDQTGPTGGTGTLVLNNSTINTSRFELGAGSLLTGDNGVINAGADGPVVIAGTISPGNSPGRIRINCDLTMLPGSRLILEIDQNGVSVDIDQLIIGEDSDFDLKQAQIVFSFLGDTNPETVDLDLNRFLRAGITNSEDTRALQTLFAAGEDWDDVVTSANFGFQSTVYDVTSFSFNAQTGRIGNVQASEIPEPATYALVLLALGLMLRRPQRATAVRH